MRLRTLAIPAALTLSAVCCTKNPSATNIAEDPLYVRIQPGVVSETKGEYTTADAIETIDLFIDNLDDAKYSYTNTTFAKGSDGKWNPETPMLWQKPVTENQNINVLAISPALGVKGKTIYDDPIATFEIEQHQSADSRKSDYLIFNFTNLDFNKNRFTEDGKLRLHFRHMTSKLRLTLSFGTEFNHESIPSTNPVQNLKIDGLPLKFSIEREPISGGYRINADNSSIDTIYPYEIEWQPAASQGERCRAVYECMLVPMQLADIKISFTIDGVLFTLSRPKKDELQQNKIHTLNITVGKDEVSAKTLAAQTWIDGYETE